MAFNNPFNNMMMMSKEEYEMRKIQQLYGQFGGPMGAGQTSAPPAPVAPAKPAHLNPKLLIAKGRK